MCTLTWWCGEEGRYEIFFNRDESKEREPALPPREGERNGVRFLAPIDPRGRGTWLLVNEFGAGFALLNWYEKGQLVPRRSGHRSRGQLVMNLADVGDEANLHQRIHEIDSADYPPFRLVSFLPGVGGEVPQVEEWQWRETGPPARIPGRVPPVSSSSLETRAVLERRANLLAEFGDPPGPEDLDRYHRGERANGTIEVPGAFGVRMNRPDSQTWSYSRISIDRDELRFRYGEELPELAGPPVVSEAQLARRQAGRGPDGVLL